MFKYPSDTLDLTDSEEGLWVKLCETSQSSNTVMSCRVVRVAPQVFFTWTWDRKCFEEARTAQAMTMTTEICPLLHIGAALTSSFSIFREARRVWS